MTLPKKRSSSSKPIWTVYAKRASRRRSKLIFKNIFSNLINKSLAIPWLDIFTSCVEHRLALLSQLKSDLTFRRDRVLARFITPQAVCDEMRRLAQLGSFKRPSYGLVIEGESATPIDLDESSKQHEEDEKQVETDNEVEQIDNPVEEKKKKLEISPIESLFRETVHTFNDEMAKSKKTLIDAQGT